MSLTDLDELQTVQRYIETLFETLPAVDTESGIDLEQSLVEQNVLYGRKIIELADKFTAKYRKDHFFDRKDIEDKIAQIYQIICPHSYHSSMDEMIIQILRTVSEQKNQVQSRGSLAHYSRVGSVNPLQSYGTKDSKFQLYRDEADLIEIRYENNSQSKKEKGMTKSKMSCENQETIHRGKKSIAGSNVRPSNKSSKKAHHDDFTTKNVLELKNCFQEQTESIKQLLEKMNKIAKNANLKFSQENSTFTKQINDMDKNNLKDFAIVNIDNNTKNMKKASNLLDLIEEHYEKKVKIEGFAQGKFKLYTEEINKRQQVFSFAVSKLLQNLTDLRDCVSQEKSSSESLDLIDAIETIGNEFYELYPSHSIIKDLKVEKIDKEIEKLGYKNYGCQVQIGKNQKAISREVNQSKRNILQLYKVSTRVGETIQRFQKSIKFKKQIDQKEIEKFVDSIRDSFPRKNQSNIPTSVATQVLSYQEDLRKILQQNEKNEKQLSDDFNKKMKKSEKKINELEKTIEELLTELKKEQESHESNRKKLSKKLENEKQQNKSLISLKKQMEKSIKEMSKEVNRLQDQIKDQYRKFDQAQEQTSKQNRQIKMQAERKISETLTIQRNCQNEIKKWQEQREIYHKKIVLLQTHEEAKNEEIAQLKVELEQMIKENMVVKKQLMDLTNIYEENVKQQEELINAINQLEAKEKKKKVQARQLKQQAKILENKIKGLEEDKERCLDQIRNWEKRYYTKEQEAKKFKELGVLNDSDINVLREELQKVKEAYMQSEEQLEQLRAYILDVENEKDYLLRENRKMKNDVSEVAERWENNSLNKEKMEKDIKELYDDISVKNKEVSHLTHENDELKREISKMKKENQEYRENYTKSENQLRVIRQDMQKKCQTQSLETGKKKLQLEAMKVELRKKTEQVEKMKENYDQKIQILQSKNKELSHFITQKQMLTRINNSHMSQ